MNAAIIAVLTLIEELLPQLANMATAASVMAKIIDILEKWIPIVIAAFPDVIAGFQGVIAALTADPSTTQAQLETLKNLQTQIDAANDAKWAKIDPDAPTS